MTLRSRKNWGTALKLLFMSLTITAVFVLGFLLAGIIDRSFGYVALEYSLAWEDVSLDGQALEQTTDEGLRETLRSQLRSNALESLEAAKPLTQRERPDLLAILEAEILQPEVARAWPLSRSLLDKAGIEAETAAEFPEARLSFRSWVDLGLLGGAQSMDPLHAGIRGAIIGSLLTILITMLIAVPIGVGSAIWLEEYAPDNKLSRFIQTNIYNLAGVPSIIYGMLGLAIFVRNLQGITQGRTILSAALTLAILVLPIIIINAQEAIKAVPQSLRQASLALGATRWQTIRHHVLPASMDRILTGSVLAMSRGIGETAPLVVVGASAFLTQDPSSVFDRFTTLPIQIYQWTALPNEAFRSLSAAAILVLLVLLIGLNSFAIIMRNRYRKESPA